ncbi:PAS domain S-box protein [Hydrogenophaga sp. T2]|uniref:hybrid sensor histidine kinase/response regulator n=1 Tax=Hydrogenophaga sp. T2 TaxID=3132823 RepID=UPI003CF782E0
MRDVTADRDSREMIRQTLEQAVDSVITVDDQMRITFCNASAQQLWQRPCAELVGQNLRVLLHDSLVDEYDRALAQSPKEVLEQFIGPGRDMPIKCLGRQDTWGRMSLSRVQVDERVSYTAFVRDITESRRDKQSLLESEYRMRTLLESLPNVAIQGYSTDLRVSYWNRASEHLFGHTAAQAMGRYLSELILPPAEHAALLHDMRDMVARGRPLPPREMNLRRQNGEEVPVLLSLLCLPLAEGVNELYAVQVDLSDRYAAEALQLKLQTKLRESQKMEALGTLASGVAHDFNNIVAAILGNVEMALLDVQAEHPARVSLYEVRKAGRRARNLVQQILAFGRQQVASRERMAWRPFLNGAEQMLRSSLPQGVALHIEVAPDAPDVLADFTQLEQVLLNLCINAGHAVESLEHGRIEVMVQRGEQAPEPGRLRVLEGGAHESGSWALLTVRDNGVGMDIETQRRIFEPFFTTKPTGKGTGLGLPVVHGVLREHDATLDIDSVPGLGTAFTIGLPGLSGLSSKLEPSRSTGSSASAIAADTKPLLSERKARVVYVDDDEVLTFLMERLFVRAGYQINTFNDPMVALDWIARPDTQVDLILTDYNMPRTNGIEFARALRAAGTNIPVAIITGHITEVLRQQADQLGVYGIVYKPDSADGMFQEIDRMVGELMLHADSQA